ncbi:hypothetical protein ACLBX9_07775 [Methylobacterium sp. A49B]
MIAALFALAAAMVIGGSAAVIQGFPYVRLESGLAMVIAGSVAASSGAVLFGLGVLALAFRRVERAVGHVPASRAREAAPVSAPVAADEGRSRLPPVLPAAPAFLVPPVVEPPFDPDRSRIDPKPEPRPEGLPELALLAAEADKPDAALPEPPKPSKPPRAEPDLRVPPPLAAQDPAPQAKPDAKGPGVIAPEDDLFAAPEASPGAEEPPALRSSLDPAPVPAPKPATRTVVGRYASGGNTYVMFEDGSIEAETPQGRFTFASLDELKAFVDGGGESGTRGAA